MDRRKYLVICLFGLVLILFAGPLLTPKWNLVPKVHAASVQLKLYANYLAWNYTMPQGSNPTITVKQGDTVSITLISADMSTHKFLLDLNGNGSTLDCPGPDICSSDVFFGQTVTMPSFTINTPGNYNYYCYYHFTSMVGTFIVKPAGPDYGVSSSPSSLTIPQSSNANSTVSITSLNNFAGSVTLSSSPSSPTGLMTSSFSVNPVVVPAGGMAKSNFTISVPTGTSPGSYSLTVTGSNTTTSRSTSVSVTVVAPDFTIISSPSSLNIPQGSFGTATITLTSLNGFSGTVSLTSTLSSSGPQVTFSPASVALPSGGSISSILSVSTASSGAYSTPVSQGSYTLTVTGTSGSLMHSTTFSLTVGSSSGVGGLPGAAIIGGGIVAAIAVVGAIVYALRRRTKTKT